MGDKAQPLNLMKLWWVIPAITLLIVVLVARSQSGKIELPVNLQTNLSEGLSAKPSDPHEPVFIRLGVIKEIGVDYIVLETKKLLGQGNELITALLPEESSIIEIQIPSYMNNDLRKILNNGGDVIPRVEVSFNDLYVGQTVEVVSTSDMYGYKEITASRVEYKSIVNTEEEL